MNTFMNELENSFNYTRTENGAVTHKTTKSKLLDMFAMGGAYRKRSEEDCILLFSEAYEENPVYALKCLFYLRDILKGQGERRFFRVAMRFLASQQPVDAARNLPYIPQFGRWDDLYVLVGTTLEPQMFSFMKHQLALDMQSKTPSLLAKWLKSENTSSTDSRRLAKKTRKAFGMTARQYRKTLSILRSRINVLEKLMSENRWDEIEFDKIPSRAGMIYKNAFAKHDIERMRVRKDIQSYADFAKDETKTVNAKALYPYECVKEAIKVMSGGLNSFYYTNPWVPLDDTQRLMTNKYWDNLTDYFNNSTFNGIAVVDTSGSMTGHWHQVGPAPIDVAISLGMYCAEHNSGPFANKYISFASKPQLIDVKGVDFCDKVQRIYQTNLCDNTNIEAVFTLLFRTIRQKGVKKEDIPQNIIIISDMEFDNATRQFGYGYNKGYDWDSWNTNNAETLLEGIAREWAMYGYELPHLIFWNCDARQNNIPMIGNGRISYISGFSPSIFEQIMSGKTGYDLMMEKLNSERYSMIK